LYLSLHGLPVSPVRHWRYRCRAYGLCSAIHSKGTKPSRHKNCSYANSSYVLSHVDDYISRATASTSRPSENDQDDGMTSLSLQFFRRFVRSERRRSRYTCGCPAMSELPRSSYFKTVIIHGVSSTVQICLLRRIFNTHVSALLA